MNTGIERVSRGYSNTIQMLSQRQEEADNQPEQERIEITTTHKESSDSHL
jgi:hypothetical protein